MQEELKPLATATTPTTATTIATVAADMVACEQCGKPEHRAKLKRKRYCSPGCARLAKSAGNNNNGSGVGMVAADALALADKLDESLAEEKMQTDAMTAEPIMLMAELSAATPVTAAAAATATATTPATAAATATAAAVVVAAAAPTIAAPMPSSSSSNSIADRPICNWSVEEVSEFIKNLPGCQDYVEDFVQQEIDGQALLLLKENHLVHAMGMKLGPALKIVAKVDSMKEVNAAAANDAAKEASVTQ